MKQLPIALAVIVASVGLSSAVTQAATRSEVASTVTQACSGGGAGCMAAVNNVLSQFGKQCRVEDRVAAQGLADAVLAISQTNTDLAIEISQEVALKGRNCFQVAYAEVLDGTGTAAIGTSPDSVVGEAGSPG